MVLAAGWALRVWFVLAGMSDGLADAGLLAFWFVGLEGLAFIWAVI